MHNLPETAPNAYLRPHCKLNRYHFAVVAALFAVSKGVNLNREDDHDVAVRHGIVFG